MTRPDSAADRLRRAYATLGLEPGSSAEQARHAYKALVKKWHPDRFGGDPRGQDEATQRMREINQAYRTLVGASPHSHEPPATPGPQPASRDWHFTSLDRSEIEHMIRVIGTRGPVEFALDILGWFWLALFCVFSVVRLTHSGMLDVLLLASCLVLGVLARLSQRRSGERP
jgi:hypothetical protein